ncbi:MAG TPA: hypothetical protein GX715_01475, partial [Armatimonadetes bacterium]|nr:hypothetical protein [Armatimonadota bacterium]
MHLIIIPILALAAPVAASPGGATGAVGLRYRVSPGEAYAHQVDLHVQIRALSPKDTPLPKHLEAGTNGWVGGRVTTLIGQRTGMATHEVVQVARLQTKHAGRTQELPRAMPAIHLVTPHGIRESAGGPGATSDSSPWGGSGSSILDPLPDAVLVPGEKWSRTLQARVPGGPAVNLETVSRYLGPRQLDGAACALIESRSNLPSLRFSDQSAAGTLTGTVELLTYHDLDTGVPRRSDGKMHWRLAFTGPKGNEAQVSIQMAIAIRQ